eukprot:189581_1
MPETMNMEELKNAVAATLEKKGILSKMRAQLRKEVFEVIDESEENTDQNHILHAITRSTTECMLADLVREYLDFYELDHTLTVFQAEAGFTEKIRPRGVLAGFMGLGIKPDRNFPLMSEVLKESESFNRGIIRCSEENNKSELVLREREKPEKIQLKLGEFGESEDNEFDSGSNPEHELAEIDRKLKLIDAEQLKLDQDVNKNQEEDQSDIDDIDEVSGESFSSMGEESSDASPSDISDNYNPYKIPSDQDGRDAARDFDVALKSASSAIEQSPTKSNRSLESLEDLESSDLDYSIDETVSEGEIQELGDHVEDVRCV